MNPINLKDKLLREIISRTGPIYFPGAEFPIPHPHPSTEPIRLVLDPVLVTLRDALD